MKYLALDTNIYIDMIVSRNSSHQPSSYRIMEKILDYGEIKLLVPNIVKTELKRHLRKEIEQIGIKLNSLKKNARNLIWINEVAEMQTYNKKKSRLDREIIALLDHYEKEKDIYINKFNTLFDELFKHTGVEVLHETAEVLYEANKRKLYNLRPFHNNKDSLADAVIIETLMEYAQQKLEEEDELYFISGNTADFSIDKTNKTDKEQLHYDIGKSLKDRNISEKFNYRIYFTKTLIDDFNEESAHAKILEDLAQELEEESINELEELEIETNRMFGGLPSLSDDWEDVIRDDYIVKEFISALDLIFDSVQTKTGWILEEYEELIEMIDDADLDELRKIEQNIINHDGSSIREHSDNISDVRSSIIDIINGSIALDLEELDDNQEFAEEFHLNSLILKLTDLNGNTLEMLSCGHLIPQNGEQDTIQIKLKSSIGDKIITGNIEVNYGYMTFKDGQADESLEHFIDFHYFNILEITRDFADTISNGIEEKREFIRNVQEGLLHI